MRILIYFCLAAFSFIISAFVAAFVKLLRPDCYTCGANVGLEFWFITIAALQPAVWSTLSKSRRLLNWIFGTLAGLGAYAALEGLGMLTLIYGPAVVGLLLGFVSNLIAPVFGWKVSSYLRGRALPAPCPGVPVGKQATQVEK